AFAGYLWFKTQKIRDRVLRGLGLSEPRLTRRLLVKFAGGDVSRQPPARAIAGVRPAQQDVYELSGQARSIFYQGGLWDCVGDHDPYADLGLQPARIGRWAPLNQSIYVAFKVMFAGLLMVAKGDRIARNSSIESRYPFLDEDVIAFASSIAPEYK